MATFKKKQEERAERARTACQKVQESEKARLRRAVEAVVKLGNLLSDDVRATWSTVVRALFPTGVPTARSLTTIAFRLESQRRMASPRRRQR